MASESAQSIDGGIGSATERREDPRLITGRASYVDDLERPHLVHMAIVRSPYAHARIEEIDVVEAEAMDGVYGVFTAADLEAAGVPGDIPCIYRVPDVVEPPHRVLARDRVRYQGKPVAVVVAEDRYRAGEAREAVEVRYDRLEAVIDPREAVTEAAPTIHEAAPDNVCFRWEAGDAEATRAAFDAADHTVEVDLEEQRIVPNAMEPRGALAEYDAITEELTVHVSCQQPFVHQEIMAEVLDHPKRKVRVIAPEVGGGFGSKSMYYPGETLAAFCSMQLDRPVKWIETRTEAFVADEHGRGQHIEAAIAIDDDGSIQGLRVQTTAGIGGELGSKGMLGPSTTFGTLLSGQYAIPAIHFESRGVFTNATPTGVYRGVGRAEAGYTVERCVERAARACGFDPVDLRRQNFIQPEQFPYESAVGSTYDSGDYEPALDAALAAVDYEAFRDRQTDLRGEGRYLGIGIACFVESGGLAPSTVSELLGMGLPDATIKSSFWETADVQVHETGEVTAYCGTASHGQGSETGHAQVIADELGVPYEEVEVIEGKDTLRGPPGTGTIGSRGAAVGGGALAMSARKVKEKARRIAAHTFEVTVDDVGFEDGVFHVRGAPDRSMTFREVAEAASLANDLPTGMEPGLEATSYYDPENLTWAFGTTIAVVEVEPETGEIEFLDYVVVDDCGIQINPTLVKGQLHGAAAQGVGQALYEGPVYDEQGQLLTGSFLDYTVPKAIHVPEIEIEHTVTPSPHNPLGVKGIAEAGAIGGPPAVVNAVTDALEPFGIEHLDMPLTPERVWQALQEAS